MFQPEAGLEVDKHILAGSLCLFSWGTVDPGQSGDWAGCGDGLWTGRGRRSHFS